MTQRSKRQIEYTLATHAIERLTPSRDALRLCEKVADGKLNADAAVESVLARHGLKRMRIHD